MYHDMYLHIISTNLYASPQFRANAFSRSYHCIWMNTMNGVLLESYWCVTSFLGLSSQLSLVVTSIAIKTCMRFDRIFVELKNMYSFAELFEIRASPGRSHIKTTFRTNLLRMLLKRDPVCPSWPRRGGSLKRAGLPSSHNNPVLTLRVRVAKGVVCHGRCRRKKWVVKVNITGQDICKKIKYITYKSEKARSRTQGLWKSLIYLLM